MGDSKQKEWEIIKARCEDRLNEEYFIELDRKIKESQTYVVEEIVPMSYRKHVGRIGDGNYRRVAYGGC